MIDPTALVAISVSGPEHDDLSARGLSDLHIRFIFTELVRFVLADGGAVAYGGRLDDVATAQPNFTRIMLDMVAGYRPGERPADDRLVNFAASVLWRDEDGQLNVDFKRLQHAYTGRFQVAHCAPAPPGEPLPADKAAAAALSLSTMRLDMAERCDARVIVGGRVTGYSGRYPGGVEEALLTARRSKPLYVVGGWGGCGALLARRAMGETVDQLTQEWQHRYTPSTVALATHLADSMFPLTLDAELDHDLPLGRFDVLNNGLDHDENVRLAVSTDSDEVVALVLRGLRRTCTGR